MPNNQPNSTLVQWTDAHRIACSHPMCGRTDGARSRRGNETQFVKQTAHGTNSSQRVGMGQQRTARTHALEGSMATEVTFTDIILVESMLCLANTGSRSSMR